MNIQKNISPGQTDSKMSKRRRGNKTDIGVEIVACCPKGECGRHTEADLVDLN